MGRLVTCCVCGKEWRSDSRGIMYRSLDGRWWCMNARMCTDRKIEALRAMQRGLEAAWRVLEAVQ